MLQPRELTHQTIRRCLVSVIVSALQYFTAKHGGVCHLHPRSHHDRCCSRLAPFTITITVTVVAVAVVRAVNIFNLIYTTADVAVGNCVKFLFPVILPQPPKIR